MAHALFANPDARWDTATGVTQLHRIRAARKLKASMIMKRNTPGKHSSSLMYEVNIVNYNLNGVCIDWDYCPVCFGFESGKIHPDCMFAPFNLRSQGSQNLVFNIEIPGSDKTYSFKGKAVYATGFDGVEKIGITFTSINEDTRAYLTQYFH